MDICLSLRTIVICKSFEGTQIDNVNAWLFLGVENKYNYFFDEEKYNRIKDLLIELVEEWRIIKGIPSKYENFCIYVYKLKKRA